MCAIYGCITFGEGALKDYQLLSEIVGERIAWPLAERGPDAHGYQVIGSSGETLLKKYPLVTQDNLKQPEPNEPFRAVLGNARGIPTTEWKADGKPLHVTEIQPFKVGEYSIVHNGIVNNDVDIFRELGVEAEYEGWVDSYAILWAYKSSLPLPNSISGSVAAIIYDPKAHSVVVVKDYRMLFVAHVRINDLEALLLSSELKPLEDLHEVKGVSVLRTAPVSDNLSMTISLDSDKSCEHHFNQLTSGYFTDETLSTKVISEPSRSAHNETSCAVVFSGGMDSTTVAKEACIKFDTVHLLHFLYGCRAEDKEIQAVRAIHKELENQHPEVVIKLEFIDASFIKNLGGSSLTDDGATISEGHLGADSNNEWVPARNLAFAGLAASYCDRYDIGTISFGLNLEESGAYCDNSIEFFTALSKTLYMGTQSKPRVWMPLARMQKSHIVKHAYRIGAPIHLSWSCYHSGDLPCGDCGPDYMRLKAHCMAGLRDNMQYENLPDWYVNYWADKNFWAETTRWPTLKVKDK